MHVWYVLHAPCCNTGRKNSPKIRCLRTIVQSCRAISSQLRHISTIGKKNLLNSNISSTCPHNMVNFGPLTAETGWWVWGTPANFNGFRVLGSLLHRRFSTEVNQFARCLAVSLAGTLYIHFPGPSDGILQGARAMGVNQTLQRPLEGATCIRQGGNHVGHRPTF